MRRRRPLPSFDIPGAQPMSELNTTPLIDVMLVLLIMFIITVPIMSHKVRIDLPTGTPPIASEPTIYRINLDDHGRLFLNGDAVRETALPGRLEAIAAEPGSELHLAASGNARYEDYDRVLAVIKRARIEHLGVVGNQAFVDDLDR